MQIVVGPRVGARDPHAPLKLPPLDPAPLVPPGVTALPPGIPVRDLTLNEDFDQFGRLIQRLGTTTPLYEGTFATTRTHRPKHPALARSRRGASSISQVTPIRSAFIWSTCRSFLDRHLMSDACVSSASPRPPDANELGWKETRQNEPRRVYQTVIMKFDLPSAPFVVPPSPRTGGHEYVWHCHILEHEEHDMMRPLIII